MGIKRTLTGRRLWLLFLYSTFGILVVILSWRYSIEIFDSLELPGVKNSDILKTVFYGIGTLIVGIAPAIVLWYFRDETKQIDQDHTERDLKLKEDNDAWANFIKYQELAEDENISEGRRAAAIYALGEYYRREGTQFPQQVHVFFKKYLDQYWESIPQYDHYQETLKIYNDSQRESKSDEASIETLKAEFDAAYKELLEPIKKIPEYIKAVHAVISSKSHEKVQVDRKSFNLFHHVNSLYFSEFNLTGANLEKANLSGAYFDSANLTRTTLFEAKLTRFLWRKSFRIKTLFFFSV